MTHHSIRGQVIDGHTRRPLPELRVEAWDRDLLFDDLLGAAVTDANGEFTIELDRRYYQEILDRRPDVYFRVHRGGQQLADTRRQVLWNVREPQARILIPITDADPPHRGERVFRVEGRVTTDAGHAVAEAIVEAWDHTLGASKLIATGATDAQGRYVLHYDAAELGGKDRADLSVRILDPRRQRAEIARSPVRYRADAATVVDLTVPAADVARPAEYERLQAALRPVLGTTSLGALDAAGVEYAANRSGWDARMIAMAARAEQLSAQTKIPAAHHYALLRSGLPGEASSLFRLSSAAVEDGLRKAASEGVIADAPVDDTLRLYREQSTAALRSFAPPTAVSSFGAMLDLSLDAAQQARFLDVYRETGGRPEVLWADLAGAGFDAKTITRLRTDAKLGHLTLHNAPLVARLRQRAHLTSAEDLPRAGLYRAKAWVELIGDDVPPQVDREAYAAGLAAQVRMAYPTLVAAEMVRRRELPVDGQAGGDGEVAAFLRAAHSKHELGRDPIKTWAGYGELSAHGRQGARLVERLYQMSPSDESMKVLFDRGLHAARQIASMSPQQFMTRHGDALPSEAEARLVYAKAQEIHTTALSVAAMYLSHRTAPNLYAITGQLAKSPLEIAEPQGSPTLEELFQNMDYCACDHCRSVLGPAAYLVDLLSFIDVADVPEGTRNPQQVLFERRPDVQHLLLSCENTNVALPYIDLVNEVLEHCAVHGDLAAFVGFNMEADSKTADLLVNPEFVTDAAYGLTRGEVYPPTLPFDMPLAALRLIMKAWDTTLPDALRIFGTPAAAQRETLGLDASEHRILTDAGFRTLPEYFGEPADATIDALNTAVANGKTFCRRMAVTYEELVELLRTSFVNPGAPLVPRLEALRITLAQLQSWYTGALTEAALLALLPAGLDPAGYGGDVLRWLRDHRAEIMGLITLTDVSPATTDCDFAALELRFALPDPAANRLDELAYHRLHRFIRLWRKLGWTIELTDRALTTFLGVAPKDLALGNLDAACGAATARIAGFVWLARRLSIGTAKLADWLAVWNAAQPRDLREQTLARLLRFGVTDLRHLAELTGIDPLADDLGADAPSLHRFLDARGALAWMKLKVVDLDYLLRHRDDAGALAPAERTLLRDLKALRDAIAAVDGELMVPANADLAFARSKMALVYDGAVVDWFLGLVGGGRSYATAFPNLEEALPAALLGADARLSFDPFARTLGHVGILGAATRAALEVAADALTLADVGVIATQPELDAFVAAFKLAAQALEAAGAADLHALELEYPELKAVFDLVAAEPDPAAQVRVLVDAIVPVLRGRLKLIALRTTLGALIKIDPLLVNALTDGPAVLHANADPGSGVAKDLLDLEAAVALDADRAYGIHVDPPATDDYNLYVAAPAGTTVTLEVAGAAVIPATAVGPSGELAVPAAVRLESGALTAVTLTLAGLPAGASAQLRWRTKAMAKTAIPAARIYADARLADARASLIRLQKAAQLLVAMPLTPRELRHLAGANPDTAGYLGELDIDGTIPAPRLHALWAKLAWVAWLSSIKADEPGDDTWVGVLERPEHVTPRGTFVAAAAGGWTDADLAQTLAHFGLALGDLTALSRFRRVKEAVDFITATGQPAADFVTWAVDAPDTALIAGLKAKLRARQDELAWRTTLTGVNDALRNQRRDALVSYILHHAPPTPAIDTADKLYEHFLIDVQMDACMKTSRIRQALSTVQLFIMRCLMNLEPEVAASSIRADQWAWMKRYRLWEANRKIFLYPENWLEPELRDNKSPFFRELESDLLKADINDELAEAAYLSYLKKLDEVARLEIVGTCLQEQTPGNQDDDILHVFGRTNGNTRQYYYRRFEYGYWTPWEKVTLNIEGDLVFPMIWKRQLFLFWTSQVPKPEGANPEDKPSAMAERPWGANAKLTVELNLMWGEYYGGKWTSPKSTELQAPLRLTGLDRYEPERLVLSARTERPAPDMSERLLISGVYLGEQGAQFFGYTFTSKNAPPLIQPGLLNPTALSGVEVFNYYLLWAPQPGAAPDSNALREPGTQLVVQIAQPAGAIQPTLDEALLTKTATLLDGFRVRPVMHVVENQWEAPLFYADEHSVFFVRPDEDVHLVLDIDFYYIPLVPPEKIKLPPLYEIPIIRDPIGPVINPLETVINPNYAQAIATNQPFSYGGAVFDARGISMKGALR